MRQIIENSSQKRDTSNQITGARDEVDENVIDGVINILSKSE